MTNLLAQPDQYAQLGVDAGKKIVREIFDDGIETDFPGAFIKIFLSTLFPGFAGTQHGDGDGSKSILRILMYYITRDPSWLYGMVDDGWSMNWSDIAAGGFVRDGEYMITDIVNLNAFNVPKDEILRAINTGIQLMLELYRQFGFGRITNSIRFLGGETADLPRQVQTSVFDMTVSGYIPAVGVVKGDVRPGDLIWGFSSGGRAAWEDRQNSGIMANGLTLGINTLIHPDYVEQYPNLLPAGVTFNGRFHVNDPSGIYDMTIAQVLLSPTRQWAILIKILIDKLCADDAFHLLHGISVNTGGGATKIVNVGTGGIVYHKTMPKPLGIFQLIQRESQECWRNMFRSFNCGIGIDVVGDSHLEPYLNAVEIETGVRLHKLGCCEADISSDKNRVVLQTPYGTFDDY